MEHKIDESIIHRCFDEILSLYNKAIDLEKEYNNELKSIPEEYRLSAKNLIHYLAVRRCDIRDLQIELSYMGLSSLGRLEAHVMAGLKSVLNALNSMSDLQTNTDDDFFQYVHFKEGDDMLREHTEILFGPRPFNRNVRIMVTLPYEAANNYTLVYNLVESGMNVARINSAHDGPETWLRMISNVNQASEDLNISCKILFDLEGPKLRTGQIGLEPAFIRLKPKKNKNGQLITPAYAILYPDTKRITFGSGYIPIPVNDSFLENLSPGDFVKYKDVRGKSRKLLVVLREKDHVVVESKKSSFIEKGTELLHVRGRTEISKGIVGNIYTQDPSVVIREGDILIVAKPEIPGKNAQIDGSGRITHPALIPCSLPEVFSQVKIHDKIFFDDGKIGGLVEEVNGNEIKVKITRSKKGGTKLRSDKGINLPDTNLKIPSLSKGDLENLDFAVKYVDMIGLSFVKEAHDVELLQTEILKRTDKNLGIILKIETRSAFENLSQLLLAGLKKPPVGVMVARGDLGVEVGFERMSEVQEQILWLCEAAHVPVIWATQVLEQMNKTGLPTRGEVTDAAMSSRAECVMLNKGPFVVETVKFLNNILVRMMDHNNKKTPMLRKLKISEGRWHSTGLKDTN
jgi:pyruvate kinase